MCKNLQKLMSKTTARKWYITSTPTQAGWFKSYATEMIYTLSSKEKRNLKNEHLY